MNIEPKITYKLLHYMTDQKAKEVRRPREHSKIKSKYFEARAGSKIVFAVNDFC